MKIITLLFLLVFCGSVSASESLEIVAEILVELNHYPSEDDKSFLAEITASDEATEEEKALAGALARVEHKVADEDRDMLKALAESGSSEWVRTIAAALLSINHQASEELVARLNKLLDGA